MRKKKEKQVNWQAWVFTSDIKSAGTDANVYITIYGDKGKSDDIPLSNKGDSFEKGNMDTFRFNTVGVGKPYKLRVWHDNSGTFAGWHLDKIELESMESKERYSFKCNRWLAEDEDDKEIVREMPAEAPSIKKPLPVVHYVVQVYTAKKSYAGTDANVYINIFGDLGDTGKRFLKYSKTNKNKFEKGKGIFQDGMMDEFEVEAVTLHKLKKIRIGHDGKGPGAGWFLDKVVVFPKDRSDSTKEVTFNCNRWLAEDEDDGLIEREITASGAQMLSTTTYMVSVKTGDVRGAGTDANVFLKIFGTKEDTGSLQLRQSENAWDKFERGRTDLFKLEATDIGKIKKIKIGHDRSKIGSAWFLDEVRIDVPSKGEHYTFACHRWLSDKEGDKQTEVEIEPSDTREIEKTIPYEVTIWTGTKSGAGTDSNVFLQLYGKDGKTQEISLRNKTDNFEKGQVDKFKIEAPDVGRLQKVRIGHDGTGMFSGWYLDKMLIQRQLPQKKREKKKLSDHERRKSILALHRSDEDSDSSSPSSTPGRRRKGYRGSRSKLDAVQEEDEEEDTEDYWFFVDQWFARGEGDKAIVRELIPTDKDGRSLKGALEELEYVVRIFTGDIRWAGTDANVFVNIYGEKGDTGERQMKDSETNSNKFERAQEDVFRIKAIDLGKLTKLNIRHDNKGGGADWFLDRVEVEDGKGKTGYFFPCQRWLAVSRDDGQLTRELVPVDQALKKRLTKRDSTTAIKDEIGLETKAAMTTYHVQVFTGDVWGAGTDANVYVILFGDNDHTSKMFLKSSMTNKNKFERNQMDEFLLELVNIGELKKIKIGHDNKGGGGAWFLDKVVIDAPSLGKTWVFQCGHWLSDSDEDRLLERELFPQELATEEYVPCIPYEITTFTSDISSAGTDAMVYVALYGKETATQPKNLCSSKRECKQRFKRGSPDKFIIELEDVGDTIEKIRIGHDGSGFGAGWHLDKVEVRRLHETGKNGLGSITYTFPCNRWLAKDMEDGAIERELLPEKAVQEIIGRDGQTKSKEVKIKDRLKAKKYTVEVFTGDMKGGGTDANVFLSVFGDKGDTGERQLRNSETNRDKFEKNKMDRFVLEAVDLGNLYKVKIRHDNSMFNPAWYLDRVEVSDGRDKSVFHCERWLAKNKDDGKIERSLYIKGYDGDMSSTGTLRSTRFGGSMTSLDSMKTDPFSKSPRLSRKQLSQSLEEVPEGPTIPYTVKVCTGDGEDNGTSSNVWIKIFGIKKLHTGRLFLELMQKEKFEPSSVEIFSLEAVDVKEVKRVEIGHDGVAPGTGWFLKDMELDLPTKGKHYHFDCKQWLAKDKGDGKTSRMFSVDDGLSSITSYKPMIPYEVTVTTGDVAAAGTDRKIMMTVFGTKGTSGPLELDKRQDRFERARTDLIKMEIDDVAPIKKVRLELTGKGSRPFWFLEKLELRNMETGTLSVFKYNGWIGSGKDEAKNPVDIPAVERGKTVLEKTSYKVSVKTSDVSGAGTDANVYVIIFGAMGDSGEVHLKDSETFKDPFEKNQLDVFTLKNQLSLGELSKVRVWHDNKGFGAAWHLAHIEIEDLSNKRVFTFHCDKWLSTKEDDKQIIRELTCLQPSRPDSAGSSSKDKTVYEIEVTTTDKNEGGTMHNAWLILEGKRKSSKLFQLVNSPHNKILRKGTSNNFSMSSAPLGKLERCIVGAFERADRKMDDPQGREAMWHCHEIVVTDTSSGERYTFPCKQWIKISPQPSKRDAEVLEVSKVEESKVAVQRNLAPVKYEIVVITGDVKGAGTNANVFITVFGNNGNTGKRPLTKAFRDLFERNQTDKFQIEALDLGELTKVKVEHDNSGFRPSWFLERVEILNLATNSTIVFPCSKWLAKDKGDGELSREIFAKVD
ncbi:lipoxygenase homology domain-containing protein 1 [Aplysia californica]|uniref:Lipoxygenase homology domain-containing protein 1 n=1 Tax=Aplysia californica TaxID=6500 RepID=A0ABM1A4V8_APLCA|nr:lipoxygenase homology domain-containing protein 1 [Aplysia californica]